MTQEQKRIKLAEAAGWKRAGLINEWLRPSREHIPQFHSSWVGLDSLPEYFNELNAVHELEKVLNAGQINTYLGKLYGYTKPAKVGANPWEIISFRVAVHATAAQRAEALGKTLNLW